MSSDSVHVLEPGLETAVQELPGRIGYWEQGFPPSGPVDSWSFRLANLLVGNARDTAALECQFLGPTLRLERDVTLAVTGADMSPKLDDQPIAMWTSVKARAGQVLALSAALSGARSYIAFSGGIATEPVLGSRAVFHMARIGGTALQAGTTLPLGTHGDPAFAPKTVAEDARPTLSTDRLWRVECVPGPNDDWLTPDFNEAFFAAEWIIQGKSNRTGIRLTGPEFQFAERAFDKKPEHGQDPSNILDHGYPLGAVNLAGQTPIILINDAPSTGGFINPFTVPSGAFWKLGQARPGEKISFVRTSVSEAQDLARRLDGYASPASLRDV
ncbi:biotin-dependent carboxyltransferase family protein [Pseudohoeflea coraliihabitans]|uniref:Biotin-dependent carboxyltransferase family protein n=1 Tax=Pseudohoeflea coraliihabitans TaxID=2860393 RepID=A0ABS6WPZ0_9HYPH|nr:biotin-dependent carboxyltransferase family protein [Pseudohoeflea sp. DP4N28-3]MBW3098029.1 biotin-dependent carboxyltransferase family protein [Pseudohoeflea sp. DP4N28-3]